MRQVIDRELLDEAASAIQESSQAPAAKALLLKSLSDRADQVTRPKAQQTWKRCQKFVIEKHDDFHSAVETNAPYIIEFEAIFFADVGPTIEEVVQPALLDMQTRILSPFIEATVGSIIDAYELAIRGIFFEISKTFRAIITNPPTMNAELAKVSEAIEMVNSGPLMASKEVLWVMFTVNLVELSDWLVGSVTAYEIYARVMDDLRTLLHNVVYTFRRTLTNKGVTNAIFGHFKEVMASLVTDMMTTMRSSILQILKDVAESMLQDTMIAPCADMFQTYKAQVPGRLQTFVQLNYMGERLIRMISGDTMTTLLDNALKDAPTRLDAVLQQLVEAHT